MKFTLWPLLLCLLMSSTAGFAGKREDQIEAYKKIVEPFQKKNTRMGQGNPAVTKHPMTTEQCLDNAKKAGVSFENPQFEKICGAPFMAPLYNPATQKPEDAKVCMDQFEFPGVPCEYPQVWTQANEAVEICAAVGKRICDAHEWEGGCAGELREPDYRFELAKDQAAPAALRARRLAHNKAEEATKSWSYGKEHKKGICAMASSKPGDCNGGDWKRCGSNTYPTGSFLDCKSPLGIYDTNGNAAEHMNIPTKPEEMASHNALKPLGYTEMKGSWFIFDKFPPGKPHEDWCRWRAPYWHGTKITDKKAHENYHLGFRCCKDTSKGS